MLFGHEHHHDQHVSALHAPPGPTPLWCKVALTCAFVCVLFLAWGL